MVIGHVERLFETGANDVMVVRDARHNTVSDAAAEEGEILIPWIRPSVVTTVDIPNRRIVADWDPDF